MHMAFTSKNSFILTTDGRVFSWGEASSCLGRNEDDKDSRVEDEKESAASSRGGDDVEDVKGNNLNEINFTNRRGRATIAQIAAGRNHVLALDTFGNVFSWGNNKFGQLG